MRVFQYSLRFHSTNLATSLYLLIVVNGGNLAVFDIEVIQLVADDQDENGTPLRKNNLN